MTTEKPPLLLTYVSVIKETQALSLNVLTLDAGVFYQLRAPSIVDGEEYKSRLLRAETAAIGYVVAPEYGINTIWLIVLEDGSLWRWSLVFAADYDAACAEHEWLADVPQIFLAGQTLMDYEANSGQIRRRAPTEQGED